MTFTWWQNKLKLEYGHSYIIDAVNFPSSFVSHRSTRDSLWGQHPTPSPKSLTIQGGRHSLPDEKTNNPVTREGWGPRRNGSQFEVCEEVKTRLSIKQCL